VIAQARMGFHRRLLRTRLVTPTPSGCANSTLPRALNSTSAWHYSLPQLQGGSSRREFLLGFVTAP
jgi:hypothetical protein